MRWICAYDISDAARRRRVVSHLESRGLRVQRSVFECDLSAGEWRSLRVSIADDIDAASDRVLWCPQCRCDVALREVIGMQIDAFVQADAFLFD